MIHSLGVFFGAFTAIFLVIMFFQTCASVDYDRYEMAVWASAIALFGALGFTLALI